MTTIAPPFRPATKPALRLDWQEIRVAFNHPAVLVAGIIAGLLAFLATLAALVFLTYTGNDTAVIATLVTGAVVPLATLMIKRLGDLQRKVETIQTNTAPGAPDGR